MPDVASILPSVTTPGTAERTRDPFVERADEWFERLSPYRRPGFRNHCLRLHQFARQLLAQNRIEFPDGLAYAVALFHDLGLFVPEVAGNNYLERSATLFERALADLPLPQAVTGDRLRECLIYNHRVTQPAGISPEAECFRRAVWIEHTRGVVRFGLAKAPVQRVFREHPRDDFSLVLLDFTRRVLTVEPTTVVDGIFLGGR